MIQSLIDYTVKGIAPKKAAILYANDEWGKSGFEAFKKAGFNFDAVETFNFGDKDFSAQLLRLKSVNPDAVVVWSSLPADAGLITNQLRQFMPTTRIICSNSCAVDEYIDLAKGGGDGVITVAPWVPGLTPRIRQVGRAPQGKRPKGCHLLHRGRELRRRDDCYAGHRRCRRHRPRQDLREDPRNEGLQRRRRHLQLRRER